MSRTAVDLSRRAAGGAAFATWLAARISEMMMVTEMMPAATAVSATTLDETANLGRMYVRAGWLRLFNQAAFFYDMW